MSSRKIKEQRDRCRSSGYSNTISFMICDHLKSPVTRNKYPPCDFVHKRIIIIARLVSSCAPSSHTTVVTNLKPTVTSFCTNDVIQYGIVDEDRIVLGKRNIPYLYTTTLSSFP